MQVTPPNEIRTPRVRLHPKGCAALKLEAERATPKHLGTPVPRTCMHALGTGYATKSGEPLRFRIKEGTAQARGHNLPARPVRHAGGDQPSRCCPERLCWGHRLGLPGCKSPLLFKHGASSCSSQLQRLREPWGAFP